MPASKTPRPTPEMLRIAATEKARELLAKGGPEFVKARDVASAIGVSVGTIYNLFGDLDFLLFEVNASVYDELYGLVTAAAEKSRDDAEPLDRQLMTLATTYLQFVADRPGLWAGVLAFNRRRKVEVPDWYRQRERALFEVLEGTLSPLSAAATTPQEQLAPQALWAAVHGIITVSVGRDGLIATHEEIANQIELVVTSVVRAMSAE